MTLQEAKTYFILRIIAENHFLSNLKEQAMLSTGKLARQADPIGLPLGYYGGGAGGVELFVDSTAFLLFCLQSTPKF